MPTVQPLTQSIDQSCEIAFSTINTILANSANIQTVQKCVSFFFLFFILFVSFFSSPSSQLSFFYNYYTSLSNFAVHNDILSVGFQTAVVKLKYFTVILIYM